jgi:hypothetical protein
MYIDKDFVYYLAFLVVCYFIGKAAAFAIVWFLDGRDQ